MEDAVELEGGRVSDGHGVRRPVGGINPARGQEIGGFLKDKSRRFG